ncbi:MAG: Smr/MutS family protein [bacterium]|jgi:DNA mismatch repair protein MutS2
MTVEELIRKSHSDLEFDEFRRKLAGYAKSARAKSLLESAKPVFDKKQIEFLLDRTQEALEFVNSRPNFSGISFGLVGEVEIVVAKARIGDIILADELKILRDFLEVCGEVDEFAKKIKPESQPRLCDLLFPWETLAALNYRFRQVFTSEGEIRDSASPLLRKLRGQLHDQERVITKRVDDLVTQYQRQYGDEVHLSLRHNRFVIALPRGAQSAISGIVVDLSGGGAQVLVEPESLIDLNNARVRLFVEEEIEVRRILLDFAREVAGYSYHIETNLEILAELDAVFARALYARQYNCTRPAIFGPNFHLKNARHPLIAGFVPENVRMEAPFRGLVVSGVNAGGKTVLLKLIGLHTLMAAIGSFIPADEGSSVPEVGAVFADIGDDQSISQQLSTFTSHLHFLKGLDEWLYGADPETNLPYCNKPALILMDEIGGGTEPTEGAALAYGVIAYLIKQPALPVLTTHYDLLKGMAYRHTEIKNISLEFDEKTLKPTFRVIENQPGKSFALDIASTFGVNQQIIGIAKSVLDTKDKVMADAIRQLDEARVDAEKRAVETRKLEEENRRLKEELKARKEEFVKESKRWKAEIEKQAAEMIDAAKKSIKSRVKRSKTASEVALVQEAHRIAKSVEKKLDEQIEEAYEDLDIERFVVATAGRPLVAGDAVLIAGTRTLGKILEVDETKKRANVEVNKIRVTAKLDELSLIDLGEFEAAKKLKQKAKDPGMDRRIVAASAEVTKEVLDLHGKTTEESFEALEIFLDAAVRAGLTEVRIMHGIGTGALRKFVGDYLRKHSQVSHVRSAQPSEGGVGVTIAVLGRKRERLGAG